MSDFAAFGVRVEDVIMNRSEFDALLLENRLVVAYFWAGWEDGRKQNDEAFAMFARRVSKYTDNHAMFVRVNVDDNGSLTSRFGVASVPYVVVFLDGEQVASFHASSDCRAMLASMNDCLCASCA